MQIHVKTEEYLEWYVTHLRDHATQFCVPKGKGECVIVMSHPFMNFSFGHAFCKEADSYGLTGWEYRMDTTRGLFYAEINACTCATGVSILRALRAHDVGWAPESCDDFRYAKLLHARAEEDLLECTIGSSSGSYPFTEQKIDTDSRRSERSLYKMRDEIQNDYVKLCISIAPYYER
jgi:hypothetical protein